MLKRTKALPAKEARMASEKGRTRRTKAVINSCIGTLNNHIDAAAMNGEYTAHTWFHNNSGFLTPAAMEVVKEYYSKLGYIIEVVDNGPEFDGDREHYQVELNWEDEAAC